MIELELSNEFKQERRSTSPIEAALVISNRNAIAVAEATIFLVVKFLTTSGSTPQPIIDWSSLCPLKHMNINFTARYVASGSIFNKALVNSYETESHCLVMRSRLALESLCCSCFTVRVWGMPSIRYANWKPHQFHQRLCWIVHGWIIKQIFLCSFINK